MSKNQLASLVEKYLDQLEKLGAQSVRASTAVIPMGYGPLDHSLWMCFELRSMLDKPDYDSEKCNRWLGFIQGVLWTQRCETIDELRGDVTRVCSL